MKNLFDSMPFNDQVYAMGLICNIQDMQIKIGGNMPEFKYYQSMTVEQLEILQDEKIKENNLTF